MSNPLRQPVAVRWPNVKAVALAAVLLIAVGLGHRVLLARMQYALAQSLKLKAPLATLPTQLGGWQGTDVPLDEQVLRKVGDDDRISREYHRESDKRALTVYVGYIGRPRMWHGHRVDICYPANGWKQESQEKTTVPMGRQSVPALLYEFRAPQFGGPRELILVIYMINGEFVNDPERAREYNVRTAGLIRHCEAYTTRIQVVLRASGDRARDLATLTDFASAIVEPVLGLMPTLTSTPN